ncbi:MAG: hypothetical protein IID37_16400 [Planctomycetes bacterium]|nr:hypothetical protein [Planctomycetota bacterium]
MMWLLARRLVGLRPAAVATALLAVSSLSIAHAQEARFYALTQFLALLGSWLLCRMLDRLRWVDALWYVVAMSILVWTHTFGWFVLAAHAVWLIAAACKGRDADPRRRRMLALGAVSGLAIVLSFSPWLPILFEQISGVRRGYWISEPPWSNLLGCLREMLILDRLMRWPIVILAVLIASITAARLLRHRPKPAQSRSDGLGGIPLRSSDLWGLVAWMVLPILVPFVWSKLSTPIFQIKYAIVAQAPALILLAVGAVRRPLLVATALALLTVCWPPNADRGLVVEDWPAVAHLLRERADPGGTIFVYRDYGYFPLDYYLGDGWRLTPVFTEGHTTTAFAIYYPDGGITFEEMTRRLASSNEGDAWLVLRWETPQRREALADQLGQFRNVQALHRFRALDVIQFQRR